MTKPYSRMEKYSQICKFLLKFYATWYGTSQKVTYRCVITVYDYDMVFCKITIAVWSCYKAATELWSVMTLIYVIMNITAI